MALVGLKAMAGGAGDDLKAMQGSWSATIAEMNGKPASKEEMNLKLVLVVSGESYRVMLDDQVLSGGTLKLDSRKTPHTLDATHTEGPFKGVVQKGIYEIKGDSMIAAFAKPGSDRPTEFRTREGTEQSIVRYTRLRK
jgi:uncharacterized protein (TIGR03067 family)